MKASQIIGIGLIILALAFAGTVFYFNSVRSTVPIVFSSKSMLDSLWQEYKSDYLEQGTGRVLDKDRNNITTSEGESYAMLRAVWMDDQSTFDQSWQWTKDNLQHKTGDHLFAWLFGEQSNGTYGVLTSQGGENTASDADTDIALALVFAYDRWHEDQYLTDAKAVIPDIWKYEVVTVKGEPYLVADNLEQGSANPLIDPSYFAPYAYRIFATIDTKDNWNGLVGSSYQVLDNATDEPLDKTKSAKLPPDWITLNRSNGTLSAASGTGLDTNYGYDALRVSWRIALDYEWFGDPRAKQYLDKLSFLGSEWKENHALGSVYAHDGNFVSGDETPAAYGGAIGYFMVSDTADAKSVYDDKLVALFDPNTNKWKVDLSYYDSNWAWFGIALYDNMLPDLALNSKNA